MYEKFKKLEKLFKLEVKFDLFGLRYDKIVLTGESEIPDYGKGYLNISLFTFYKNKTKNYQVRCVFNSIDDTDFGGWSKEMSFDEAEELKSEIAYNILKELRVLPSIDEINSLLMPYGIYIYFE